MARNNNFQTNTRKIKTMLIAGEDSELTIQRGGNAGGEKPQDASLHKERNCKMQVRAQEP